MDHAHVFFLDPLQIKRKEVRAEAVGHTKFEPRRGVALVGAQDPATAFLAHIPFGIRIAQNRVLWVVFAPFDQRRIRLCHDKLVLNGDRRDLETKQF